MAKHVFDTIGYDIYKGLKHKLPPIRLSGVDDNNDIKIILAHPKDFIKYAKIFKEAYDDISKEPITEHVELQNIKQDILEIYPSTKDLQMMPNGFVGLFVSEKWMDFIRNEFHENDEFSSVWFIKVSDEGLKLESSNMCGVIDVFIKKFNKSKLVEKYKNMYLVIGQSKNTNFINGESQTTNEYNIFGGKRNYDENTIQGAIREITEEMGLYKSSQLLAYITHHIYMTKDILRCQSFNIYCLSLR
jgi:hypothetical protein